MISPGFAEAPARVKEAPIPMVKGAHLFADDHRLFRQWCERVLIEPFKKRLTGEPWNAAAITFVETAVDDLDRPFSLDEPAQLWATGRKLSEEGCRDPLVRYLTARIGFRVEGNWRTAASAFYDLFKELKPDPTLPRALLCFIGKDAAAVEQVGGRAAAPFDAQVVEWTKAALTEGSFRPEDDVVFLKQQVDPQWVGPLERQYSQLAAIYMDSDLPEWLKHTLRGHVEIRMAWAARGGGWASSVTQQGWKGFNEHLGLAQTELMLAWKQRPDRPEAATAMIGVVMGSGGENGTVREWFDRAVTAQFDYLPAYHRLLWAYRPRWGGSHEQMLAFGRACRDTRRFETDVPTYFISAIDAVISEYPDWRLFYRQHPELRTETIDYFRAMLREPSRKSETFGWQGGLAIRAWAVGDYPVAAKALAAVHDEIGGRGVNYLHSLGASVPQLVAEVALQTSGGAKEFERAEKLYAAADLAGARAAYEKAAKLAPAKSQALVQSRQTTVDFEREFSRGEWMKVTPQPGLLDWSVEDGDWRVEEGDTLVNYGSDAPGMIVFNPRVGCEVEVRGEFEIVAPEKCCRSLGVALGYHRASQSFGKEDNNWLNCIVYQNGHRKPIASLFNRLRPSELPQRLFEVKPNNQFFIRIHAGKVTYQVNGETIFEEQNAPEDAHLVAEGQLGFGAPKFCANNTTRIRHIEVRRLTAAVEK